MCPGTSPSRTWSAQGSQTLKRCGDLLQGTDAGAGPAIGDVEITVGPCGGGQASKGIQDSERALRSEPLESESHQGCATSTCCAAFNEIPWNALRDDTLDGRIKSSKTSITAHGHAAHLPIEIG